MTVLRVAICDDALVYPVMVGSWLQAADDVDLVGSFSSRAELLQELAGLELDVLLLDVLLPEGELSAADVADVRALAGRPLRIVLVSSYPQPELSAIAEGVGADGCCTKGAARDGLLAALHPG